jgi:GNAT superfamily N-acetyltransferase
VEYELRPGRPDDLPHLAAWTRDTFSWGDYVADAFLGWLTDPDGLVVVSAGADGVPVAVARVTMLSPREAWIHAARVRPDVRRAGLGMRINDYGAEWARRRGGLVMRLLIEDWNEPSRRQVAKLGYRPVAAWGHGTRPVGPGSVDPRTNGGRRVPGEERLVAAPGAEAEPAWVAWSTGELAAAAHHLWPVGPSGWYWRRMTFDDLAGAARGHRLWHSPSGWAVGELDDEGFGVSWVVTTEPDAPRLVKALLDRAEDLGADRLSVKVPLVPWLEGAFSSAGCDLVAAQVYERSL